MFSSTTECCLKCSDILTPFPAFGVPFEIDNIKGPVLSAPIQSVSEVWEKSML